MEDMVYEIRMIRLKIENLIEEYSVYHDRQA